MTDERMSEQTTPEVQLLGGIARAILSSAVDLEQTFQAILDGALKLIHAKYGNLMLINGDELVIRTTTTNPKEKELGIRLKISNSISGLAVLHKKTIFIPNVDENSLYRRILQDEYMLSELATPLIENDHVIGVINIESPNLNAFSKRDEEFLEILAGQAVIAITNARYLEELKILREIDQAILSSAFDLDTTLQVVLDGSLKLINARYGNLMLIDGDELVIETTTTRPKERELGSRLKIGNSISGLCVVQKETILIPNVAEHPLYRRILRDEHMRSELASPLIESDVVIGVLNIESPQLDAFTEHDKHLLATLAGQAAIAINNARDQEALRELRKIDQAILNSAGSLDATLRIILNSVEKLIGAEYCAISLVEGNELVVKACSINTLIGAKVLLDNSVTGLAVTEAKSQLISNIDEEPLYWHIPGSPRAKSELVAPMLTGKDAIGVINVESARLNAFRTRDLELLMTIAGQAALAIKNAQYIEEFKQIDLIKASGETAVWLTHKIGNLAMSIEWPVERLWEEVDPTNESAVEDLQMIHDAARQIVALKQNLIKPLQFNRTEAVELGKVFENLVDLVSMPEGVISINLQGDLPRVKANYTELSDVFSELLINAMDAMEKVLVKKIELTAYLHSDSDFVEVKVADNGCGIPPDQLDQIWTLGFTTKPEQGGTGYGTYKCAQLLRKIDAPIFVESEVNRGTTFTIRLPAWRDSYST